MNVKNEFLAHIKKREILCAFITHDDWSLDEEKNIVLPINFTKEDFNNFLALLDFDYDNGYGTQVLYGTIWYKDNTWSQRFEYDGSEAWNHLELPTIPIQCFPPSQEKEKVRYIYQLPPDLQEKAIANTISLNKSNYTPNEAKSLLLSESFSWNLSPEGYEFWSNLWEGWE